MAGLGFDALIDLRLLVTLLLLFITVRTVRLQNNAIAVTKRAEDPSSIAGSDTTVDGDVDVVDTRKIDFLDDVPVQGVQGTDSTEIHEARQDSNEQNDEESKTSDSKVDSIDEIDETTLLRPNSAEKLDTNQSVRNEDDEDVDKVSSSRDNNTVSSPADADDDGDNWRCVCETGFLPPGLLKSFGGMEAMVRMSTGQCYHKT